MNYMVANPHQSIDLFQPPKRAENRSVLEESYSGNLRQFFKV